MNKFGHVEDNKIKFHCPGCNEMHVLPVIGLRAWQWNSSLEKPTLSPSVLVRTGHYVPGHRSDECWCSYNEEHADNPAPFKCTICHSFVKDGQIQFLSDCTHALAGQTVELPDLP